MRTQIENIRMVATYCLSYAFGFLMPREEWLKTTYGTTIYWPASIDQIGTMAEDGTPYATQEQYDACNAVTGSVGGVQYDNNSDYFKALYVGTTDDTDNTTFWGAWNIVLPYLINKYPLAKILLIVPYGCYELLRQCVRNVAVKFGLLVYDFNNGSRQLFYNDVDSDIRGIGMIGETRVDALGSLSFLQTEFILMQTDICTCIRPLTQY